MRATSKGRILYSRPVLGTALLATTMLAGVPVALAQESNGTLEQVVVTAQKRSEDLQKVPIAVSALTTQKLEDLHLQSFTDFARYLPNVTYAVSGQGSNGGPGFANITMRGIASDQNGNHSGPEPTVGVYFDEQPITTINGTLDIPAYDVQRVEALSGPQGTLYGASAESGVVRIISNKPDPSAFAADYTAGVDAVDHGGIGYTAHGMLNQPLADGIALRIVAWDEHDAGYIDNVLGTRTYTFNNSNPPIVPLPAPITISNAGHTKNNYNTVDKLGARVALGIDIGNNWTITPTLMVQREDSDGVFGYDPNFAGDLKVQHFLPEYVHDNWYQAALTVQGKIGSVDVTYSGGYMDRHVHSAADYTDYTYWYDQYNSYYVHFTDNAGNTIDPTQRILGNDHFTKQSHELRFSTDKDARFRVTAGAFYEEQKHYILQDYVIEGLASPGSGQPTVSVTGWPNTLWLTDQSRDDRDYALFGEASFDILKNLTLTAGIRGYRYDNSLKGFFGFASYETSHCFAPTSVDNGPCTDLDASAKGSGETHKVNLTWQVTDDKMVYATYSTGFRPGGVNRVIDPSTGQPFAPYASDTLDNYELGWKTSWLDGRLRANGAFYWENWNKFQFPFLGPNSVTIIANGGAARVKGVEYEVELAAAGQPAPVHRRRLQRRQPDQALLPRRDHRLHQRHRQRAGRHAVADHALVEDQRHRALRMEDRRFRRPCAGLGRASERHLVRPAAGGTRAAGQEPAVHDVRFHHRARARQLVGRTLCPEPLRRTRPARPLRRMHARHLRRGALHPRHPAAHDRRDVQPEVLKLFPPLRSGGGGPHFAVEGERQWRRINPSSLPFPLRHARKDARATSPATQGRKKTSLLFQCPKWHDLVVRVVADIGAAEIGDARYRAPMPRHLFLGLAEFRIVGRHRADPPEPQPFEFTQVRIRRDVEQRPVGPVHVLRHVLDHQHMAGEIGHERRADEMAEDGEVERRHGLTAGNGRFQRIGRPFHQIAQAPRHRRVSAVAVHIRRDRTVRHGAAGLVERGEQEPGIAVAQIGLCFRRWREPGRDLGQDPVGAVTAARHPQRIERRIVGDGEKGFGPRRIVAREMTGAQKALRMEDQFDARTVKRCRQRRHALGQGGRDARGGCRDADPEFSFAHHRPPGSISLSPPGPAYSVRR